MIKNQSGNVLFLILIAVALFAALSFVVGSSMRSGSEGVDPEKLKLQTSQIFQYVDQLKFAYTRMVIGGIASDAVVFGDEWTPCTSGNDCIFSPEGGGVIWSKRPIFLNEPSTNCPAPDPDTGISNNTSQGNGATPVPGVGTAAGDEVVSYGCIPTNLCLALNEALGITGIPVDATGDGIFNPPGLNDVHAACILGSGGQHVFYSVVYPH
jgi:hypothetical protein